MRLLRPAALTLGFAALTALACTSSSTAKDHEEHEAHADAGHHAAMMDEVTAVAVLYPTKGNKTKGVVLFTPTEGGKVRVTARVTGLKRGSKHGFHVHEYGDPTAPDGTSAGGHYNPEGHEHGLPDAAVESRHAGDFGNLVANDKGVATYDETFDNITIAGKNAVIGRGVIVHADPDDGSQPTGNAGPRIAVGVVGVANPDTKLD